MPCRQPCCVPHAMRRVAAPHDMLHVLPHAMPCHGQLRPDPTRRPLSTAGCLGSPLHSTNRPLLARLSGTHVMRAAARQGQRRLCRLLVDVPSELQHGPHCTGPQGTIRDVQDDGSQLCLLHAAASTCSRAWPAAAASRGPVRTCIADRCAEQRPDGMVKPAICLHAAIQSAGCRFAVGKRNECAASSTRRLTQRRQRRRRPAAAHGAFGGDRRVTLPAMALASLTRASRAAAQAGEPQVRQALPLSGSNGVLRRLWLVLEMQVCSASRSKGKPAHSLYNMGGALTRRQVITGTAAACERCMRSVQQAGRWGCNLGLASSSRGLWQGLEQGLRRTCETHAFRRYQSALTTT